MLLTPALQQGRKLSVFIRKEVVKSTSRRLFLCIELNESAEEERPAGRTADGRREERGEESVKLNYLRSSEALFRQPGDVTVCVWLAAGQLRPRNTTEKALRNQPQLQGEHTPGRRLTGPASRDART